jgi:hypothetical protein
MLEDFKLKAPELPPALFEKPKHVETPRPTVYEPSPEFLDLPVPTVEEVEALPETLPKPKLRPKKRRSAEAEQFSDIDLEVELMQQYNRTRELLQDARSEAKFSELASLTNTLTTILVQLIKLKTDVYNAERIKRAEEATVEALAKFPLEVRLAFLEAYYEKAIELDLVEPDEF